MPQAPFYTPWKHQGTSGFFILSGCKERPVAWKWLNINSFIEPRQVEYAERVVRTTALDETFEKGGI